MSLYETVIGANPLSNEILVTLGLTVQSIPRFRDVYIKDDKIVVYARIGGNNRTAYSKEIAALRKNWYYKDDQDSKSDNTYANFYFMFPAQYEVLLRTIQGDNTALTPEQKMQDFVDKMQTDKDSPEVQEVINKFRPMFAEINDYFNKRSEDGS